MKLAMECVWHLTGFRKINKCIIIQNCVFNKRNRRASKLFSQTKTKTQLKQNQIKQQYSAHILLIFGFRKLFQDQPSCKPTGWMIGCMGENETEH